MTLPTPAEIEAALKWADNLDSMMMTRDRRAKVQNLAAHIRTQSSELALMKAVVEAANNLYCGNPTEWLDRAGWKSNGYDDLRNLAKALAALKKAQEGV